VSSQVPTSRASTRQLARTRGAASGMLLVVLGAWGALVPFIGPWFDFAYSPDTSWHWTSARGWLEVLPGVATFVGGLLLLTSTSRVKTSLGAWLGIAGGAWFVVGQQLAAPLHLGSVGTPTGSGSGLRALESLAYFYALGAVILFLAATAFGRLSVVTVRDLRVAERRDSAYRKADEAAAREVAAREGAGPEGAHRDGAGREPTYPAPAGQAVEYPQNQYPQNQYPQNQYPQEQYPGEQNGPGSAGNQHPVGYHPPPIR
jgi:hypothetical protein